MKIKEALKAEFVGRREFEELKKAITTTDIDNIIQVEFDDEIKNLSVQLCPFLERLEQQGRVKRAQTYKVGFKSYVANTPAAQFISEEDDIPSITKPAYDAQSVRMSVLIYPIDISDVVRIGSGDQTNIETMEIQRGTAEIRVAKEQAIIQGDPNTTSNLTFNGLTKLIPSDNVFKKADYTSETPILDAARDAFKKVKKNGGSPTVAVMDEDAAMAVTKEMETSGIYNIVVSQQAEALHGVATVGMVLGAAVRVPILTTPNAPANKILLLTENELHVRDLLPISRIPLAKTKLAESSVLAHFTTFFTTAPARHAIVDISSSSAGS